MDENEDIKIIESFRKFAKESSDFYGDELKRRKSDREYAGGGSAQWSENDRNNRGSERSELTVPLLDKYINAVVNPFARSPYSISIKPKDQSLVNIASALEAKIKEIENDCDADSSKTNAIRDAVTAGRGYVYITNDFKDETSEDETQTIKICLIDDANNVIPDPFDKTNDGSKAEQMAVLEYYKKDRAKELFGDDIVNDRNGNPPAVSDFGSSWNTPEDSLAMVTYFRIKKIVTQRYKDNKTGNVVNDTKGNIKNFTSLKPIVKKSVEVYKMIGDKIVFATELDMPYIPIVPFNGQSLTRNNKKTCVGIVNNAKALQGNINRVHSLVRERLDRAPKNVALIDDRALDGHELEFAEIDKNLNPTLSYNGWDEDNKQSIPAPIISQYSSNMQDLISVEQILKQTMSDVIGMPQTGLVGSHGANETAEAVKQQIQSAESNLSHYFDNARSSTKQIGKILLWMIKIIAPEEIGVEFNPNDFDVTTDEGPRLITTREAERKGLESALAFVPDVQRAAVLPLLIKTFDFKDSEKVSDILYATMDPNIKSMLESQERGEDPEAIKVLNEMQATIDEQSKQLDQFMNQISMLQNQIVMNTEAAKIEAQAKVLTQDMSNQNKLQVEIMKQESADARLNKELLADAEKNRIEQESKLQKTIIDSEAKIKSDMLKVTEMNPNKGIRTAPMM